MFRRITTQLRKTSKNMRLSFGHCPKGGGWGSTGIQKLIGSFVFPYFDLLLDIKWGEGGGGSTLGLQKRYKFS